MSYEPKEVRDALRGPPRNPGKVEYFFITEDELKELTKTYENCDYEIISEGWYECHQCMMYTLIVSKEDYVKYSTTKTL